jgi:hypothetical protein
VKIALCFAGQPRSFRKGYEFYKKNLLDVEDVDVFIHTWNSEDNQEILDLYKPKRYLFEDTKFDVSVDGKYTNTPNAVKYPPRFTVSSYYSIFCSTFLRIEQEVKTRPYDFVIKTRMDYAMNGRIPFGQLDRDKLYIPNCRIVPTRDFGNDQFAFGSSQVMTKYMSTYLYMDQYYSQGAQMIGEDMMAANIRHHGLIGEKLIYVDMNNPFPPGPHNGSWHSLIRDDYDTWTK